jgi:hypothetical protein
MKTNEVIKECRAEAKKYGLTFKIMSVTYDGKPRYMYTKRYTGKVLRSLLTLGTAYDIACSGELVNYNEQGE